MHDAYQKFLIEGQRAGSRYALAMPRRVPMGLVGSQVGQRAGSSLEFKDHREYQPGDDLRRIDWSAFGRSDRLHVKLYREEVNPHTDILLDGSRSMDLTGTDKAAAALALTAAFAAAAGNSHYTHAAWLARTGCEPIPNSTDDPAAWEGVAFDHDGPLDRSLLRLPPRFRPHSIRILISDLLWMGDPEAVLQQLARQAAVVVIVQLLARDDTEPPQRGNLRLVDAETGQRQEVFIDAAAQQRYRNALARHQDAWNRAAKQIGAVMTSVVAEDLLADWNLGELVREGVLEPG